MTITLRLRRQGVSKSFRQWFLPCPHGHGWHIEFGQWRNEDTYLTSLSYPNCNECHKANRGQIAHSEDHRHLLPDALRAAEKIIWQKTGQAIAFDDQIEAYMYHGAADLKLWPYVASDVFVTCATYEPGTDTIRHEPTNYCLIAWGGTAPCFNVDKAADKYRAICERSHEQYLQPVNQRSGERDAKGWLAWVIGEVIKDEMPDEHPVIRKSVIRD